MNREAVRSKFVEGREKLGGDPAGGGDGKDLECCERNRRLLKIGNVLPVLILLVLLLLLVK